MISKPGTGEPAPCITQADISTIIDSGQSGHISSIDWMRLTGQESDTKTALRIFSDHFPDPLDSGHGFGKFRRLLQASDTPALFASGNVNGGSWLVELSGEVCQSLTTPGVMRFVKDLQRACPTITATRVDVAVDLAGDVTTAIADLKESIQTNDCTPNGRKFDPRRTTRGDVQLSDGFYVGSRQSRQFLRVYDKGLETKCFPRGRWIRWEVQFNKEASPYVLGQLLRSHDQDALCSLAQGFYTNVDGPGRKTWLRLGDTPQAVPAIKKVRSGDGFINNFKRCSAPTVVQAAARLQTDPYDLARELGIFDVDPSTLNRSPERERVVRDIVLMYSEEADADRPDQPNPDLDVAPF